jgi:tripartite ATP-independent transporter DctP family solute receptor
MLGMAASAAVSAPLFTPFVARGATRKFRLGHSNSLESGLQLASTAFKKYLVEKSEGRLDVDIFPSGQLGPDIAMTKAVSEGTLDACINGAGTMTEYSADYPLIELPFLFASLEAARKSMDGPLADYLAGTVKDKGIVTLALGESGFREITANKPVRSPSDLKGVKIRVPPSKILLTAFNAMGAVVSTIPFSSMAEAMRTGVVEAQENSIAFIVGNPFMMQLQTHVSMTNHVYSPAPLIFSSDAFEELSAGDKAILKAGGAVFSKATRDFGDTANASGLDKIKAAGMTLVTDIDKAAFMKAAEAMSEQLAAVSNKTSIANIRGLVAA